MPKILYVLSIFLVVITCSPLSADTSERLEDAEQLSEWAMNYYKKPEPHLVFQMVKKCSKLGLLKSPKKYPPLVGFIVGVNKNNPEIITELSNNIMQFSWEEQKIIIYTIWLSENKNAKNILNSLLQSGLNKEDFIKNLLIQKQHGIFDISSIGSASILDIYWGYFFATGDEYPVIKIIGTLPWLNKPEHVTENDLAKLLIAGAARWSLGALCVQDDRVFSICRQQLASQPEEVKVFLAEIVAEAEKERAERGLPAK